MRSSVRQLYFKNSYEITSLLPTAKEPARLPVTPMRMPQRQTILVLITSLELARSAVWDYLAALVSRLLAPPEVNRRSDTHMLWIVLPWLLGGWWQSKHYCVSILLTLKSQTKQQDKVVCWTSSEPLLHQKVTRLIYLNSLHELSSACSGRTDPE